MVDSDVAGDNFLEQEVVNEVGEVRVALDGFVRLESF